MSTQDNNGERDTNEFYITVDAPPNGPDSLSREQLRALAEEIVRRMTGYSPASPSPTEGEARKVLQDLVEALDKGVFWNKWLAPLETARAFLSQYKGGGSDE